MLKINQQQLKPGSRISPAPIPWGNIKEVKSVMKQTDCHLSLLLTSTFLSLFAVLSASGGTPVLAVRGAWAEAAGDKIEEVAVRDGYAYLANGLAGLRIISLTNPAAPSFVGAIPLPGLARGVAVAGDYACVANWWSNSLQVIKISNPAVPVLESDYATSGAMGDVEASGSYAYVAGYTQGVHIFDIADPEHPILVSTHPMNRCNALVYKDGYVFAAGLASGLSILDVKDAARPTVAGVYLNHGYTVHEVAVSGQSAYLLEKGPDISNPAMDLVVLDISDLNQPATVGRLGLSPAHQYLAVTGRYVVVGSVQGSLSLIDVSDPAKPVRISTHHGPASTALHASRPLVSGGLIYWPVGEHGLEILSIEEAPALSISRLAAGGKAQVNWEIGPGSKLQWTDDLANPQWQDAIEPQEARGLTLAPAQGNRFYRVVKELK